jgi:hypothetical protein
VVIRSERSGAEQLTAATLAALLEADGVAAPVVAVEILDAASPTPSETRARFVSLEVQMEEPGRVLVHVTLELGGVHHIGEAGAEASPAGELRASAMATVHALEQVVGERALFSLIGIKEIHVFDHDVVAVLLYSPKLPDRRLIGLSIIIEDRQRSAALAVLNATNRAVGTLSGAVDR